MSGGSERKVDSRIRPWLLRGSWVVISGVISRVAILITHIRGLIILLLTTHEPPSRVKGIGFEGFCRESGVLNLKAQDPKSQASSFGHCESRCVSKGLV